MPDKKFINLPTTVVKNLLTHDQRYRLYKNINDMTGNTLLMLQLSRKMTPFRPDEDILKVFTDAVKEHTGMDFIVADMCFTRYEKIKSDGKIFNPKLDSHTDVVFKEPRISLDYQVSSNTDWDITIKNVDYTLKDNDLLIFSGTHQEHSRPVKQFKDDEYIDLLFIHFSKTGEETSAKQIMRVVGR